MGALLHICMYSIEWRTLSGLSTRSVYRYLVIISSFDHTRYRLPTNRPLRLIPFSIFLFLFSLSLSVYIHTYMHIYMHVCMYSSTSVCLLDLIHLTRTMRCFSNHLAADENSRAPRKSRYPETEN